MSRIYQLGVGRLLVVKAISGLDRSSPERWRICVGQNLRVLRSPLTAGRPRAAPRRAIIARSTHHRDVGDCLARMVYRQRPGEPAQIGVSHFVHIALGESHCVVDH